MRETAEGPFAQGLCVLDNLDAPGSRSCGGLVQDGFRGALERPQKWPFGIFLFQKVAGDFSENSLMVF
jgi:hypothetical protein